MTLCAQWLPTVEDWSDSRLDNYMAILGTLAPLNLK